MFLFFISVILTALSAFFITSLIEKKKFIRSFIYFFIIMFAQIVFEFELLSLFSAISTAGLLVLNTVIAIISGILWIKNGKPLLKINIKTYLVKLFNTLKRDKYLAVLGISFIFMLCVSLFLISFMPIVNPDAEAYHVVRSLFWIGNGNFNHFDISEVRMLPMPINSEILYAWILMLTKKQIWFGIFPFIGYMLSIISLYGIMSYIKIPERKKLWAIFILSSFPSVIVQISGTETDIIISGLILSSIYLFWNSLKNRSNVPLFMSSLCYALAIGTKTPAIILIPAVGLWMAGISYYYYKKDFYKPVVRFLGFGLINFILFASYNYILNIINYGNIAGSAPFLISHQNIFGIRGMAANFVKHLFLFFDFTGFTWGMFLGKYLIAAKTVILSAMGLSSIPDGIYSKPYDYVNKTLLEPLMGMSILGFLIYLPCWLKSLIIPAFSRKRRDILIFSFGLILLIGIISMSASIMFMSYNIRFLTSFCVIAAPVLIYSYPRKNHFVKFIITFFAVFGLVFVSTNLWARPAVKIFNYLKSGKSVSEVREVAKCSLFFKKLPENPVKLNEACKLESKIRSYNKQNKFLYFSNNSETTFLTKMLDFEGYQVDFGRVENLKNIDLSQYNMLIILEDKQFSTNLINTDRSYFSPLPGADCGYINLDDELFKPGKDKLPYLIKCQLSPSFYSANGFKLNSILKTTLRQNKNSMTIEYKFYENINNPIVK